VFEENFLFYSGCKVWRQLRREGFTVREMQVVTKNMANLRNEIKATAHCAS
jgi:hypothetical protein